MPHFTSMLEGSFDVNCVISAISSDRSALADSREHVNLNSSLFDV